MFMELAPYLRQRAVLLTVTHLEEDQIRVNVIPQKIKEGENTALTTPLTVTGTAEELDRDLPATLVDFVGVHLGLKNTLERAKAEMDAAAKAAQAEARSKSRTSATKGGSKPDTAKSVGAPKPALPPEPPKPATLFDATASAALVSAVDEEDELLQDTSETEQAGEAEDEFGEVNRNRSDRVAASILEFLDFWVLASSALAIWRSSASRRTLERYLLHCAD